MIRQKIREILEEIGNAELVTVTKSRSIEEIIEAIEAGARIIGENRVDEARKKYGMLKDCLKKYNVGYHFIGHLQSNKVNKAVGFFDLIQSVDSVKLAEKINKRAEELEIVQDILVQVNIGEEEQKYGVPPGEVSSFIGSLSGLGNIRIKGLMCIAPYSENPEDARPYFSRMKKIYRTFDFEYLSMGMTNDYRIALEEGSNMVRIGTAIFGERKY
ncbi:TPA: YggS family pyridoxal phosphate-dependent enzyme [Candidatus Woesearchaeota archaeon]|nr:hypothetical protein QT06_C0001G0429 [archaeon GW2011_AR15]MBS3103740.1 YggS family pyridoxal phosphate-dependent enzyme [Candidatus Woesearchaeota archaeon]HIH41031.1 YggS family pyridoxal phosphate-dependent enzyme [Candidatus Woesearchaeota archaeon]